MNVEQTMKFILDSQARAEIRMQKADERAEERWKQAQARMAEADARAEERWKQADARIAAAEIREEARGKRLDRKIEAIAALVRQGMRMIARTDAQLAELAQAQKELAQAQQETQRTLKSFMASLRHRNGSNGR